MPPPLLSDESAARVLGDTERIGPFESDEGKLQAMEEHTRRHFRQSSLARELYAYDTQTGETQQVIAPSAGGGEEERSEGEEKEEKGGGEPT